MTHFDHARLDLLSLVIWSRETYAKHSIGAKEFWSSTWQIAYSIDPANSTPR